VTTPIQVLLTGIPGTGKTTLGDYLRDHHGFVHVDAEQFIQTALPGTTWQDFTDLLETHRANGRDTVVTWGFMPPNDNDRVRDLQARGLRMIWLEGDREAALRLFNQRGSVPEELFHVQMARIANLDLAIFNPVRFDPFDGDGQPMSLPVLANRLLTQARE
jgi:shikimate kinase